MSLTRRTMKNPFEVLGLAPKAIRGLRAEQILMLVQDVWKAQMRVFSAGALAEGAESEKMRELNWARDELDYANNAERFEYWRREFVKPKQTKQKQSEEDWDQLFYRFDQMRESLGQYWIRFESNVVPSLFFGLPPTGIIMASPTTYLPSSPFRPDKMGDLIPLKSRIREIFRTPLNETIEAERVSPLRAHFHLAVAKGKIVKSYFAHITPGRGLKELPEGWVELSNFRYLVPESTVSPTEEPISVIGSIRSNEWTTLTQKEGRTGNLLLGGATVTSSVSPTFGWDAFKEIAHLISTDFWVGNTVAGVSKKDDVYRYHLIGKIIFIKKN